MTNCDKCKLYRDALDSLRLKIDRAIARIEGYAADMVCDTGDETSATRDEHDPLAWTNGPRKLTEVQDD